MSGLFNFDDMENADWSQLTQYDGAGSLSSLLNTSSTAGNSNSNGMLGSEYVGKLGNSFSGGFSVPASLNNSLNMSSMSALSTSSAGTAVAPHLLHHGQQQHGHHQQQQLPHHLQHLQHLGDDHLVPLSTQDRAVPTSPDASLSRRALNKAMQQHMQQQQQQQTQPLRHSPPSAAAAAAASNTDYMGRPLVPSSAASTASTTTGSNSGVRTRGMKQAGANPSATTSTTAAVPTSTGTTASNNNNASSSSTSHNTTTTTTTTAHSSPRGQRRYKYYPKDEEDDEDDDDSLPYNKRSKIVIDPDNMTPEELEAAKVEKNRQSARDCRLRKKRYMESLEKKLREAEATIAAQQQTIESLRQENRVLMALTSPTVPLSLASTSAASSSSAAAAASGARSGSSAAVPSDEPISPTFEAVMKMVASS